ncbi:hypothetical protein M1D51_05225 [Arthrobacter sp. R3-55]
MTLRWLRRTEATPDSARNKKSRPRMWLRGSIVVSVLLIAVVARLFGIANEPDPLDSKSESAAAPPYPISGYFISASSSDATNQRKLAEIKALGGDTVITFGTLLKPATVEAISVECQIDGKNCTESSTDGISVNRYFTYSDGSRWDTSVTKCPRDRTVMSNNKYYTVLVLPTKGNGCTSTNGVYDVVVIGGNSKDADDPSASLAAVSTRLGMQYYAGLPSPVKLTNPDYLPDLTYQKTLALFTERFLEYQAAVNDVPGLAGFYHHTEMPLSNSPAFDSILSLYEMQNRAVRDIFPTRAAIVSPYLDTRRNAVSISVEEAREGSRRIADTSGGLQLIIAVQDGMGTGKAGAFLPHEADDPVDRFAATVVGKGSWSSKYVAPIREYFLAALSGLSGTDAVLWANLEGMTPATPSNACGSSLRGQSSKVRLDRQLQQLPDPQKVVSFMWDSYYTCEGTGVPLKNQLKSSRPTPIITGTKFDASDGRVEVQGFSLTGGRVEVRWTTNAGEHQKMVLEPRSVNLEYGQGRGANPKLELIIVDVGPTSADSGRDFAVTVVNSWGGKSEEFVSNQ